MNPRNSIIRTLSAPRCVLVLLAFTATALAQKPPAPFDITLQPATTSIHWTLNTTVHTVHGTFKLKSGELHIDPTTGNAAGQIVIDATSGESGDSARDKRMHGVVLDSSKYPSITFRPTHVDGKVDLDNGGPLTVSGVLNLHGQDHFMQITVNIHPKEAAIASQSHFTIPFVAWGLKDPSFMMFRTDREVTLDIDATAILASPQSSRTLIRKLAAPNHDGRTSPAPTPVKMAGPQYRNRCFSLRLSSLQLEDQALVVPGIQTRLSCPQIAKFRQNSLTPHL